MAVQIAISLGPKTRKAVTIIVDLLLLAGVIGCIYLAISFLGVGDASDGQTSANPDNSKNNMPSQSTTYGSPQTNRGIYQSKSNGAPNIRVPARTPDDAIKGFYNALQQGRCGDALIYRPEYQRCEQINHVQYSVTKKDVRENRAIFHLDAYFTFKDLKRSDFHGFVCVDKINQRWIINKDSYDQDKSYDEYQYLWLTGK